MGKLLKNILFTVEKIGPYHNARFNKISECKEFNLSVLETNISSQRYPWEENLNKQYEVFGLCSKNNLHNKFQIKDELSKVLKKSAPDIIFLTGWNENISHYLFFISQIKKILLVILSDSRFKDSKRIIFLELIKKLLLRGFSSAIVAGKESEDYLIRLGFPKANIFKPCNVVDNEYFLNKKNIKIKSNYILCVARFLNVKII